MSTMAISWIVFGCVSGGALLGFFLRAALPEHHLKADSKDLVNLAMGLIATMAALVLGLLVASAKSSFDSKSGEFAQMSANVILLDRVLVHYGPEADEARDLLHGSITHAFDEILHEISSDAEQARAMAGAEGFYDKIQKLSPKNEAQRALMGQAIKISADLAQTRWLLFAQRGSSIPTPFLVVLVFWLTILFASFSLFAPPNPTVIATLLVCALSVSGAIFLILELDRPFDGLIQISTVPLNKALEQLGG